VTRKLALLTLAVAILGQPACGPALPNYDYGSEPDPRTREYVLGISDELAVNVWKNPDLSTASTIRPDGTITMPLIGDLKAAHKTPSQLKAEIETRLQDFIKLEGTAVTVSVTAVNSYRFTVSGEVVRPGIFAANQYTTVADAIALAGGFTRFAERDAVSIQRRDPKTGEVRKIPIMYSAIASGNRPEMNLVLLAGDSVHVP
jgi:polysaccharide export outer membrane protein